MTPLNEADKADIRQLLRKADTDLSLAEVLAPQAEYFDQLTFHCQQAAEKYLKTRLMTLGIIPAKTHDLVRLLDVLSDYDAVTATDRHLAEFLTPYAVKMRYLSDEVAEPAATVFVDAIRLSATACAPSSKPRSANRSHLCPAQSSVLPLRSQWPSK